jgi:aminoglycoside phosphotransferase (APT) family kinase protein
VNIDSTLVRGLIAAQFPQWADLPVRPVDLSGWDNRTFRLGDAMLVRLPSAEGYAAQVDKEQRWLPRLAPQLPLPIPTPLAVGAPDRGYPWKWSIYRWLDGQPAAVSPTVDRSRVALQLADFLKALEAIDATDGPAAGVHNGFRGGPLSVYDREARESAVAVSDEFDSSAVLAAWDSALGSQWTHAPVWVHGDVAAGNLLVRDGALSAVIDFGCCGLGDPACDLVIAWTFFAGASRAAFKSAMPADPELRAPARGWALWKALITLVGARGTRSMVADDARAVIADVLAEHQHARSR